ncbi:uncharacterized protein AB675_10129 [Cyphellophora attinorum]|uniref:Uncharacterized protein n=1 Tax=Cyphellophora attinorum TaxID=1664694 RepID=A0A0N1NXZ8_9EURO|nr:uncharacterized protein AB675_10129 [Phialophora attinorum]KPI35215.1 hypothetical protein AB675_10129 [Phialophora attinorum]
MDQPHSSHKSGGDGGSEQDGVAATQQASAQICSYVKPCKTPDKNPRRNINTASSVHGSPATHEKASRPGGGPHTATAEQQRRTKPAGGQAYNETRRWVTGDNSFALIAGGTRERRNGFGIDETRRAYDEWPVLGAGSPIGLEDKPPKRSLSAGSAKASAVVDALKFVGSWVEEK